jgi:hypothetical protein
MRHQESDQAIRGPAHPSAYIAGGLLMRQPKREHCELPLTFHPVNTPARISPPVRLRRSGDNLSRKCRCLRARILMVTSGYNYGFVMPTHCGTASPAAAFFPNFRQRLAMEALLTKSVPAMASFIVLASPDRYVFVFSLFAERGWSPLTNADFEREIEHGSLYVDPQRRWHAELPPP